MRKEVTGQVIFLRGVSGSITGTASITLCVGRGQTGKGGERGIML